MPDRPTGEDHRPPQGEVDAGPRPTGVPVAPAPSNRLVRRVQRTLGDDERAVWDLVLTLGAVLLTFVIFLSLGAPRTFFGLLDVQENPRAVPWLTLGVLLAVGFMAFSVRRWRDLQREVRLRREAEDDLLREGQRMVSVIELQHHLATTGEDLDELVRVAADRVLAVTGGDAATVETREGGELVVRAGAGQADALVGERLPLEGSLSERCLGSGEPVLFDTVPEGASPLGPGGPRMASVLAVPLAYQGEVLGVLKVAWEREAAFSEADLHSLQLTAGPLATALGRRQTHEEQEVLLDELTAALDRVSRTSAFFRMLQTVAVAANEASDPDEVVETALVEVCTYAGFDAAQFYLREPGTDVLVATPHWYATDGHGFRGLRDGLEGRSFQAGQGLPGRVLETGEAIWVGEVRQAARDDPDMGYGVSSALAFPVTGSDGVLGVFELFSQEPTDPDESLTGLLTHVGTQVGQVFQRNRDQRRLNAYARQLERSNEELEQFAYVASHDLQEPLRMVQSYVQLLERRFGDELDEDGREFIGYAVEGVARMHQLIADLLKYSRVESQGTPFEPVDLEQVVDEALAALSGTIEASGAEIRYHDLPTLKADAGQLRQVFQNLVGNALKFRREEVRPLVEITAEPRGAAWAIHVTDNGIGIEPEHHRRIFTIFQRLNAREVYPGTGIGLAICKRIVERHGGQIELRSEPRQGSTFTLLLPRDPSATTDPGGTGAPLVVRRPPEPGHHRVQGDPQDR